MPVANGLHIHKVAKRCKPLRPYLPTFLRLPDKHIKRTDVSRRLLRDICDGFNPGAFRLDRVDDSRSNTDQWRN